MGNHSIRVRTLAKVGFVTALVAAVIITLLLVKSGDEVRLSRQDALLQQQSGQLALATAEIARLSNRLSQAEWSSSLTADQQRDLLRLRNEVGRLREAEKTLEKLRQENFEPASDQNINSDPQEQRVWILKDVLNPGQFTWNRGMTVSNLVALAQGFTGSPDRYLIGIKEPNRDPSTFGYELVSGRIIGPVTMIIVACDSYRSEGR